MNWALKRHCSERDYILFVLGCETGLRVGDIINLETQQTLVLKKKQDKSLPVKDRKKNTKNRQSTWLFSSRKGDKSISPTQTHRQLNKDVAML